MDFINNTFVLDSSGSNKEILKRNMGLIKITNIIPLLSQIYMLLNAKYETYLIWGIKAFQAIFQPLWEIIFKWRDDVRNGTEVAGEIKNNEKSRYLKTIFKQLQKIISSKGVTKGRMRENTSGDLFRQVIPEIELFLSRYSDF